MVFVALVMNVQPTSRGDFPSASRLAEITRLVRRDLLARLDTQLLANAEELFSKELLTIALIKEQGRWLIRLTALSDKALASLHALVQACSLHPYLLIEQRPWIIEAADFTRSCWAGVRTWEDFLKPSAEQRVRLHLGTPLLLSTPHQSQVHSITQFPHPLPIFMELACQWRSAGGPVLPGDVVSTCEMGTCRVADYCLHTLPVSLSKGDMQAGFWGWIIYECHANAFPIIATITALARFAFFAGIGPCRMQGMGAVRVAPVP